MIQRMLTYIYLPASQRADLSFLSATRPGVDGEQALFVGWSADGSSGVCQQEFREDAVTLRCLSFKSLGRRHWRRDGIIPMIEKMLTHIFAPRIGSLSLCPFARQIRGTHPPPLGLRALPSPPSAPPRLRGRVAHEGMPPPPPFPLSAARGKRAHEGMLPPAPPLPTWPRHTVRRKGDTRGHATPSLPHLRGRGAHGGTLTHHSASAPPLPSCPRRPVRAEGGTRGWPPPSLPHSRGRGAHEGTPASPRRPRSRSLPLPSSRHPVRAERGTRGHATPGSTLPHSGGRGARGHAAPSTLSPLAAPPRTREGGTRGHATPGPTLPHLGGRVLHAGTPPPRTRGKGACEGTRPPAPSFPIRAEGRVHAGTPLRLAREGAHEAKQGRRGLRAPAFTAPHHVFARRSTT
ncbi:hypothetical protein EDB84DRAFT_1680713 [Lactarius hengduanensis]|nr:hypothetical protein EDB84DRAFT_1680713 [Lactarius hengduanensis]